MEKLEKLCRQAIVQLPAHRYDEAKDWYKTVNKVAERIGKGNTLLGASVIAALSPQVSFAYNIRLAEEVVNGKRSGHTGAFLRKAAQLIQLSEEGTLTEETAKAVLNGPKVTAFFENILRPETSQAVTIDVWMYRFLPITWKHQTPKRYRDLEKQFQAVAKKLNHKPHELQAVCWVYVRGNAY